MKKGTLLPFASTLLWFALLLTGCSQEEEAPGGDRLPDGAYPVTFTATVEGQTATRATTVNAWDGDEQIAVQVNGEAKQYTAAAGGTLSAANGETPWYWQSITEIKHITAWHSTTYSNTRPTTFSVQANQSGDGYQQSDMLYAVADINFRNPALTFKHLPAKIVVNLKAGDGVSLDDVQGAIVTIENQALASGEIADDWTVAQATVTGSSPITPNEVTTTHDYNKTVQALLVPQQITTAVKFIKVSIVSITKQEFFYSTTLDLAAGKQYTYNITVLKNKLIVTTSGETAWTGSTEDVTSSRILPGYTASDLKIGDYYYSDGTTSDGGYRIYAGYPETILPIMPVLKSADGKARTVLGIVLEVSGRSPKMVSKAPLSMTGYDSYYKQKDGKTPMKTIQGYVLALYDANEGKTCTWGSLGTEVGTDMEQDESMYYGYANTNAIKAYAEKNNVDLQTSFPATYYATTDYENKYAAPENSSGWFLPCAMQCRHWYRSEYVLKTNIQKSSSNSYYG